MVMANTTANMSLCFKTEAAAKNCLDNVSAHIGMPDMITAIDDFGNETRAKGTSVAYALFIDVARSQWREFELDKCVNATRTLLSKRSPLVAA